MLPDLRVLNIKQPWAGLIASREKTMEVRSWRTHYRGRVVIAASKAFDKGEAAQPHLDLKAPRGVTLCHARLSDVIPGERKHRNSTGGFDPTGYWCWVLEDIQPVPQIAITGKLGLWKPPGDLVSELGLL